MHILHFFVKFFLKAAHLHGTTYGAFLVPPLALRRAMYPVLAGQGHDCIVVHKWLSVVLSTHRLEDIAS